MEGSTRTLDLITNGVIFLVHESVLLRDNLFPSGLEVFHTLLEGVPSLIMGMRAIAICDLSTMIDPILIFAILRRIPIVSESDAKTYFKALVRPLLDLDYEELRLFDLTDNVVEQLQRVAPPSSNGMLLEAFKPVSSFPTQIYFLSTHLSTDRTYGRIEDEVQWPIALSLSSPKIHGYLVIPDVTWEQLKAEVPTPSHINHILPIGYVPSNAMVVVLESDSLLPSYYDVIHILLRMTIQVQI
ncbi:hypothetical protein GMRT_14842 [Giardia muris]|uniref:Uncharacterized protein n=1 Tax=Giardia muris TaxID=5742 RepID=A0A4Z1SRG1_GIAMU|nr:hypothetical protein GMRT_14842 [Giardia muris]|eukprot:TNJ26218.1 hypothetical protein GMRT_14842 [Giardia muris]